MSWRAALLVGLAAVPACESVSDTPEVQPCPDACLADPAPHCIRALACDNSAQCPSGTRCLATTAASGTTCEAPTASRRQCLVPAGGLAPSDLLIDKFRARLLSVQRDPDQPKAMLRFSRPDHARIVVCALFGCLPEFESRESANGLPSVRIVNHDQCVVAREVFDFGEEIDEPSAQRTFNLGDESSRYLPDADENACGEGVGAVTGPTRVSRLTVGCWAYDDTHIISASRLFDLTPAEVFDASDLIPTDATCTRGDYAPCYVADENRFGTCLHGTCRHRCVFASECPAPTATVDDAGAPSPDGGTDGGADGEAPDAADSGAPAPAECPFLCQRQRPQDHLGVCVEGSNDGR